ncbi:MAG: hypothetical protein AMS16_06610 [Planctomycetes bacterium DG_58]|nr:MAG: hypothetical protein AMS16_06610 [Planctomycetes bacterium DG_58]
MSRPVFGVALTVLFLWSYCWAAEDSTTVQPKPAAPKRGPDSAYHELGGRYIVGKAPPAKRISLKAYTALKAKYALPEARRTREGDGWRSYDLILDSFDKTTATVAVVTQYKSKGWNWVHRYRLERGEEADRALGIPEVLAARARVIGGVKYGMTLRQVFAKKGLHCKVNRHAAPGSVTFIYDDVVVHVQGWDGRAKGRVVSVAPATDAVKEDARHLPYLDTDRGNVLRLIIRDRAGGDRLLVLYRKTTRSIKGCEDFIRQYPDEVDLCAGAQLRMAKHYRRQGQPKQAVKVYREAIDEYGYALVPDINYGCTVKDWALYRMGLCYGDIGQRAKAMEIFGRLMRGESTDFNTKGAARVRYLAAKQSHLKLEGTVTVAKKTFTVGEIIPVTVLIRNDTDEEVVFRCHVKIRRHPGGSYGVIIPRSGAPEITLAPHSKMEKTLTFTPSNVKALEPNDWRVECSIEEVPFTANAVVVKIVNR